MSENSAPPDCGHDFCLMEEALHERGACTEYDQIVLGVYCPHAVCRWSTANRVSLDEYRLPSAGQPAGAAAR